MIQQLHSLVFAQRSWKHVHTKICTQVFVVHCAVTKLCPTLCDPMNCSTPGFPVLHYLLEFSQTHVHWVDDAIQPSHLLLPPHPAPALHLSQHQGLFHTGVYSSSIHNCQISEAIRLFFSRWMDKWTVVYLVDGMLFGAKKKWAIKSWKDMEET